jgi:hypothetical protein
MAPAGLDLDQADDRLVIAARGLALTLWRHGARWEHALTAGGGVPAVAASLEDDAARDQPARVLSPVYQEVQRHPADDAVVFLLTGQSGPHHFSAVLSARSQRGGLTVDFDVADRCRAAVDVLAASYLVRLASGDLADAGVRRIARAGTTLGGGRLEFAAEGHTSVALAEAGRAAARVQALARILPSTHTQRLHYRWHWTAADTPA